MKLFWIFIIKKSIDSVLWEEIGAFSIFFLFRVSHICDALGGIPVMKLPQTSYIAAVNSRSSPQRWKTFLNRWFHSIKHQSTIVNNAVEFFCQSFCSATLNISRGSWKWKRQTFGSEQSAIGLFDWWCWDQKKKLVSEWHFLGWFLTCKEQRVQGSQRSSALSLPPLHCKKFLCLMLFPLLTSFSLSLGKRILTWCLLISLEYLLSFESARSTVCRH